MGSSNKYDAEATKVRESTEAAVVAVVVTGGNRGDGFSLQLTAKPGAEAELLIRTATMLRGIAQHAETEAMGRAGASARDRARVLLEAGRTTLAMLSYGLGQISEDLDTREVRSIIAAVQQLTAASGELGHVLALMAPRSRGEA